MHKCIIKSFKKYHIFGFTGTPIFKENAMITAKNIELPTTPQVFGDKLHTYTIVDAINDENVLPFRIDYINTVQMKDGVKDIKVKDINRPAAILAPERISAIVTYILDNYDTKTMHNECYDFRRLENIKEVAASKNNNKTVEIKEKRSLNGFNSLFAVDSIDAAKCYYNEFKKQQAERGGRKLKVAIIYSYAPNEEEPAGQMREEDSESTTQLDQVSRDFLDGAIKDYNEMFGTSYDTSSEKFQNYYKDVSLRMKNRDLDILIVVNMFLTGFDATTLNTLWVDKNLRQHGLIQAFSRTNRILNSVKAFGNIVCFRDLQYATNDAIGLFGDKDASSIVLLKAYDDYMNGYTDENGKTEPGYIALVEKLKEFPEAGNFLGEEEECAFIRLFGKILKLRNILSCFDDFKDEDILNERQVQQYTAVYNELYRKYKERRKSEKTNVNDDLVFEVELVKSIEVNIDYILMLVDKYHESNCEDGEIVADIMRGIAASPDLRSKKDLIEGFIALMNTEGNIYDLWEKYILEETEKEITAVIEEFNLNEKETHDYVARVFRDGEFTNTGTDLDRIMPKVKLFGGNRREKEEALARRLELYFEKYFGLGQVLEKCEPEDGGK